MPHQWTSHAIGFDRYSMTNEYDLVDAVWKLQKFRDGAEPACQPAPAEAGVSDRPVAVRELNSVSF